MNAAILNLQKQERELKSKRNFLKYKANKVDELFPILFEKVDQQLANVQSSLRKEFSKLYKKN